MWSVRESRPDRNAFVERYHRSFQQECLSLEHPHTLQEVAEATSRFVEHYNQERPNQALTCHNQPPAVAHPLLPVLPSVPLAVDPDGWLHDWDGWQVRRLVSAQGSVKVDVDRYYVSTKLAGQWITVHLHATERRLHFWHQGQLIRSQPLKGLVGGVLPWPTFVATLSEQARSQDRRRRLQVPRMASGSDPSP
jgi:Integrase core domain